MAAMAAGPTITALAIPTMHLMPLLTRITAMAWAVTTTGHGVGAVQAGLAAVEAGDLCRALVGVVAAIHPVAVDFGVYRLALATGVGYLVESDPAAVSMADGTNWSLLSTPQSETLQRPYPCATSC